MDTGDGDAIELWVKQGYLPTIRALMERGCWGRTVGPEMICEYGVGLTMFSGVSSREHGYYYLRQLRPGTYDLVSVRAPASAPPFWSHLRGTDARVLVVDVPDAQLVPGLAGLQLTDWGTHHGSKYAPEAEPPELLEDVRRSFGPRIVVHAGPNVSPGEGRKVRASLLERVRRKGALCRELLGRGPFDLAVIFFSDTDAASHSFWKYRPEAAGPAAEDDLRYAIRDVYTAIDAELGKLLERLPSDANVFFLSLYGMQDEYPVSTLIESFLRELGYHAAAGSNGASGGKRALDPLGLARRIVPQGVREAISRRLPERHQEHLLATRLRDTTDWSRTTAFAIPSLFTSSFESTCAAGSPGGLSRREPSTMPFWAGSRTTWPFSSTRRQVPPRSVEPRAPRNSSAPAHPRRSPTCSSSGSRGRACCQRSFIHARLWFKKRLRTARTARRSWRASSSPPAWPFFSQARSETSSFSTWLPLSCLSWVDRSRPLWGGGHSLRP